MSDKTERLDMLVVFCCLRECCIREPSQLCDLELLDCFHSFECENQDDGSEPDK
jgi:hypothetical protein